MSSKENRRECVDRLVEIAKCRGVRLPEVRGVEALDDRLIPSGVRLG